MNSRVFTCGVTFSEPFSSSEVSKRLRRSVERAKICCVLPAVLVCALRNFDFPLIFPRPIRVGQEKVELLELFQSELVRPGRPFSEQQKRAPFLSDPPPLILVEVEGLFNSGVFSNVCILLALENGTDNFLPEVDDFLNVPDDLIQVGLNAENIAAAAGVVVEYYEPDQSDQDLIEGNQKAARG